MDQAEEYLDSRESKSIVEQQLNVNSDHIAVVDKSLSVTKTHSCHVAAIESLNLYRSGSNSGSYNDFNCLAEQNLNKQNLHEVSTVDKSLTLASSADSSDSGIDPSTISDGKSNGIVDQLLTTKRSDSDSHDESNSQNGTLYLDAVSELDSISSSTSYSESSCVVDQSSTPKRSDADSYAHGKSSELVSKTGEKSSNSDQDVAVVVAHKTLSTTDSETDVILESFVDRPLTARSDDDSDDSYSDVQQLSDEESHESDEPVEIFGGFYFTDDYFTEDYLDDTYYSDESSYERNGSFETSDWLRAEILKNEIESHTSSFKYPNRSSETTEIKCPICLAPFDYQEDVRALLCGHVFHTQCVDQWFVQKHLICPNCKLDLKSARGYFEN